VKSTISKANVASLILGVIGVLWFVSLVTSIGSSPAYELLYKLATALTSISLALEPEILFRTMSLSEAKRPLRRSPWVRIMSMSGAACFVLSGLLWVAS